MDEKMQRAVDAVVNSGYAIAFTGAGISVESGIPPFRGEDGLWSKVDPNILDLDTFYSCPEKSWAVIKELFYNHFDRAQPNAAHRALADLERLGKIKCVITQNIDNLHQEAGSEKIYEFHGNSKRLICTACGELWQASAAIFASLPPKCKKCGHLLKPDFVFFGETIPQEAWQNSFAAAERCDVLLIVGTTGEVMPANLIPEVAKNHGATIIECNTSASLFTEKTSDIFLQGRATESLSQLAEQVEKAIRIKGGLV